MVKNEFGKIFGGYLSKSLGDVQFNEYVDDPHAFMFSITEKKKFIIKESETKFAARKLMNYGPIFGQGYDLAISN